MRGAALVWAAALSACVPAYDRTASVLESQGGLRWSNSPVVLEEREPELADDDRLGVTYSVLLENSSPEPVDLLLTRSVARIGGDLRTASSECRVLYADRSGDVRLLPGQRTRVDCRLQLTLKGMNQLALRDSVLSLVIPAVHGDTPRALGFAFQLRREDRR